MSDELKFAVGFAGLLAGIYLVFQIADRGLRKRDASNAGALWVKNETRAGQVM